MQKKAFTLTEILVVMVIIAIIASLVSVEIVKAVEKAKVAKVIGLVKNLEVACEAFYEDNNAGWYPIETSKPGDLLNHALFKRPVNSYVGAANWKGPYIKKPLTQSDNPFASWGEPDIGVNNAWASPRTFDLDGDGTADKTGNLSYFYINGISPGIAALFESILDKGVAGDANNTGMVQYNGTDPGKRFATAKLYIYLMGGD